MLIILAVLIIFIKEVNHDTHIHPPINMYVLSANQVKDINAENKSLWLKIII